MHTPPSSRAHAAAALLAVAAACALPARARGEGPPAPAGYAASVACRNCHARIFEEHVDSHHERSSANPLFQAQYFDVVLPAAGADPALAAEARRCVACHAPVASARGEPARRGTPGDPALLGVTCDLCHRVHGYAGAEPGNGNWLSSPGAQKLGPIEAASGWHRAYCELHTRSELCATCHEATNRRGVRVKSTWTEWRESAFAAEGVQCQDCHMTLDGFLVAGRSRFEAGRAARAGGLAPPSREELHTHRFPGAHSRSQVEGALTLEILPAAAPPRGAPVRFAVAVDNGRTGHRMPTGSAELRLLWLEVTVRDGEREVALPATSWVRRTWSIAGRMPDDALLLGADVPEGSRVYRAVLVDADGRPTLSSWDAVHVAHDNRLRAGERRVEIYELPPGAGPARVEARLRYLSYPTALAGALGVPAAEPVEVAAAAAEVARP